MQIESLRRGEYLVFRILEDITRQSDISEIKRMVEDATKEGHHNIAISFTPMSYLISTCVALLVQCYKVIAPNGGRFAIVQSNSDTAILLNRIGLDRVFQVFRSEDELLAG